MKVPPRQADAFVRKPPDAICAVLVYGPDSGLAHERTTALVEGVLDDPTDAFRYAELTAASVKAEPAALLDETLARSLVGGRRVVLVPDASDALTATFSDVLEHPGLADPEAALILARAGELAARSSLRRLFENAGNAAAIACYADEAADLQRLVSDSLREAGVTAEPAALDFIVANLSADRMLNRRELEKLALYAGRGGTIDMEDAAACLGDSAAATLDDTVLAAADGDYPALERALDRGWAEGLSPVAVLRAAQRHLQRLHLVSVLATQQGRPLDEAMKALRPPVFWKSAARFRRQAAALPPHMVEQALTRLTETEILVKSTGMPDRAACSRALLAVAQMARTARRR